MGLPMGGSYYGDRGESSSRLFSLLPSDPIPTDGAYPKSWGSRLRVRSERLEVARDLPVGDPAILPCHLPGRPLGVVHSARVVEWRARCGRGRAGAEQQRQAQRGCCEPLPHRGER